ARRCNDFSANRWFRSARMPRDNEAISPLAHSSSCGFLGACAGVIAAFLIADALCEGWECFGLGPFVAVAGAIVGLVLGLAFGVITRKSEAMQATIKVVWLMIGFLVAGVMAYQLLMPSPGN
ncbi:MAG TPA: hypothetical protein VFT12_10370, partial [Thermoanaerobaculia bacterium]|nr:hypothetical protein [Thermoanaerobaculia bacterium]